MADDARWPEFTWDSASRRYRNAKGRFVSRRAVRQVLDEVIDSAAQGLLRNALALQAGHINLVQWQINAENNIRLIHTAATAAAAGGWAQATAADWAYAGHRIRKEFTHLDRFARQIANGLPLDGRFIVRSTMYGAAASRTYETRARQLALATGMVLAERRLIHSFRPCEDCVAYEALDWQPPGVLPDIGEDCKCEWRCRCSFERLYAPGSRRYRRRQAG